MDLCPYVIDHKLVNSLVAAAGTGQLEYTHVRHSVILNLMPKTPFKKVGAGYYKKREVEECSKTPGALPGYLETRTFL